MNDDLLIEILARLPVKSLFRFKSVSKSWCRLISCDHHLRRRLPLLACAVFCLLDAPDLCDRTRYACSSSSSARGLEDCDLDFFPLHRTSAIVDCCDGLVLCRSSRSSLFHVVNPSTKRWRSLPEPRRRSQTSVLAFDPHRSPEFKVVSVAGCLPDALELEVFRSETGTWAEQTVPLGLPSDAVSTTMCFFDGTLHVLAYPDCVLGIDLDDTSCRKMELPEPIEQEARIGTSGGRLCYAHKDGDRLKIWMLGESSSPNTAGKWMLKTTISLESMARSSPKTRDHDTSTDLPLQMQLRLLAFHPQKDLVYLSLPGRIMSYDLNKNLPELAYEVGKEMEKAYFFKIWLFPFSCYMSDCVANE